MARAKRSRGWRPDRRQEPRSAQGAWSAALFNVCLALFALASAACFILVARDNLYAYELTPGSQRDVKTRVERLAGELIQMDFDRRRQWDDLVAMELINGDISAARGFLLSARAMLPQRDAALIDRATRTNANDAEIEVAALDLLTPGTRSRYESTVPLLSRRAASGAAQRRDVARFTVLGDARDFELLASAMLADPESDPLQFTMTGLGLGLSGDLSPLAAAGASSLIAASRRPDFSEDFAAEFALMREAAAPIERFRSEAIARASEDQDAASYPVAAAAFRAAINPRPLEALIASLEEIGMMQEATSPAGAALLVTHARSVRDLPRLRLIAQAAGDRATAAAKHLPRDGALPRAARGSLTWTPELAAALALTMLAAIGLAFATFLSVAESVRLLWERLRTRNVGGELVQSFDTPWRVL